MLQKYVYVAALAIGLVGCASVPMADPAQDAALKAFAPKPDVAGVYIYRNESLGSAVRMELAVDGKPLGQTAAKTFCYTEVNPGKHAVTSKSENVDNLDFEALAGKLYFVWQEVKMGAASARSKLHLASETEGKSGVSESKLAASQ